MGFPAHHGLDILQSLELAWKDGEELPRKLGFSPRVKGVAV